MFALCPLIVPVGYPCSSPAGGLAKKPRGSLGRDEKEQLLSLSSLDVGEQNLASAKSSRLCQAISNMLSSPVFKILDIFKMECFPDFFVCLGP